MRPERFPGDTQLHALSFIITYGSCRGAESTVKTLDDQEDKVLYGDLDPLLYVSDDEEIRFGCTVRFRELKGPKEDDSEL